MLSVFRGLSDVSFCKLILKIEVSNRILKYDSKLWKWYVNYESLGNTHFMLNKSILTVFLSPLFVSCLLHTCIWFCSKAVPSGASAVYATFSAWQMSSRLQSFSWCLPLFSLCLLQPFTLIAQVFQCLSCCLQVIWEELKIPRGSWIAKII